MNLVVDTLVDESDGDFSPGDLSLREAIELANANPVPDTIRFFPFTPTGGSQRKVLLTEGELVIRDDLTISGAGLNRITIDASGNDPTPDSTYEDGDDTNDGDGSAVFLIDDGRRDELSQVHIKDLTITGGDHGSNAAVESEEDLQLTGVTVTGNSSVGVSSDEELKIADSVISNNSRDGIFSDGELELTGSRVTGNSSLGVDAFGPTTITDSTISNNREGVYAAYLTMRHTTVTGNVHRGISSGRELDVFGSTISNNGDTGIFVTDSSFAIRQSTIIRNNWHARSEGGGIKSLDSNGLIEDTTISHNFARSRGGGIFTRGGNVTISNTTISNSEVSNGDGGGIYNLAGSLSIEDSTISGNKASHFGAGITNRGTLTIANSNIVSNSTPIYGGGVFSGEGSVSIKGSNLSDNSAFQGGGIRSYGSLDVIATTIHGNTGGGLELFGSTNIQDTTISGNNNEIEGGGIRFGSSLPNELIISNSTISGNRSQEAGGGIWTAGGATLHNTTVAGNIANGYGGGIMFRSSNSRFLPKLTFLTVPLPTTHLT